MNMPRQLTTYADRLQAAMKAAGYTTVKLADALGVSRQAVKKVEDGKSARLMRAFFRLLRN